MRALIYSEGQSSSPFANQSSNIDYVPSNKLASLPAAVYEEIELIDVVEFDPNPDILSVALQKLRHGGLIRIVGTDALQVMRGSETGKLSISEASKYLLEGRLRLTSAHDLKNKLTSMNMAVSTVSLGGFRYLVEAHRQ